MGPFDKDEDFFQVSKLGAEIEGPTAEKPEDAVEQVGEESDEEGPAVTRPELWTSEMKDVFKHLRNWHQRSEMRDNRRTYDDDTF